MVRYCGAKTRSGAPCKSKAMPNGRCRMHGGKSTGVPGNKNAAKPGGLYSKFLSPEEKLIAANMELGSLEDELRLTRIRLIRVLEHEEKTSSDGPEAELQIESRTVEPVLIGGLPDDEDVIEKRTYKRRDHYMMVERLTARIANLEMQCATLRQMSLEEKRKTIEIDELEKGQNGGGMTQNVIIVPGCSSIDEWEKSAQRQQESVLKND